MDSEVTSKKMEGKIAQLTIRNFKYVEEGCKNVSEIMDALEKDGYVKFIFDLQYLTIASSIFIGLIAKKHYILKEKGGGIVILKAQDLPRRSFELFGLLDVLKHHDNQEEALQSF